MKPPTRITFLYKQKKHEYIYNYILSHINLLSTHSPLQTKRNQWIRVEFVSTYFQLMLLYSPKETGGSVRISIQNHWLSVHFSVKAKINLKAVHFNVLLTYFLIYPKIIYCISICEISSSSIGDMFVYRDLFNTSARKARTHSTDDQTKSTIEERLLVHELLIWFILGCLFLCFH